MAKSAAMQGIEVRHESKCSSTDMSKACKSCNASYRAAAYDRKLGKQRKAKWTQSLPQARADRVELQQGINTNALAAPNSVSFREAAEDFIAKAGTGEIRNRSRKVFKPSVVRSYQASLRLHVLPTIGAAKLSEIQRRDLQDLIDRMELKHSASTIRNAINPIRAIYRHAFARDLVKINPTIGLEMPAVDSRRERIASVAEAKDLLSVLKPEDRPVWATAFYAGLRLGELRALRWENVDLDANVIHVRESMDHKTTQRIDPKSKAGFRKVPVIPILKVYLLNQRMATDGDLVFPGSVAKHFNPSGLYQRSYRRWDKTDRTKIGLHECRHTFASLMIAAGVNIKAISVYMGHSSVAITLDLYGHLLPDDLETNGKLLNAFLEAKAS